MNHTGGHFEEIASHYRFKHLQIFDDAIVRIESHLVKNGLVVDCVRISLAYATATITIHTRKVLRGKRIEERVARALRRWISYEESAVETSVDRRQRLTTATTIVFATVVGVASHARPVIIDVEV